MRDRPASARRAEAFGDAETMRRSSAASRPRAPLGVRRATPEVPRARPRATKTPVTRGDVVRNAAGGHRTRRRSRRDPATRAARRSPAPSSRILAALLDVALLSALDASILYFTLRLLGLATAQIFELPLLPLVAFFLLLNGGYFIAFTAVGGQSIGKMALGIKVISQEESTRADRPSHASDARLSRVGLAARRRFSRRRHQRRSPRAARSPRPHPRGASLVHLTPAMRRLAVFICSFGYIGFFPFAPGTVGSAAGVAVYLAARYARRAVYRADVDRRARSSPASSSRGRAKKICDASIRARS